MAGDKYWESTVTDVYAYLTILRHHLIPRGGDIVTIRYRCSTDSAECFVVISHTQIEYLQLIKISSNLKADLFT